jgi:alkanesulfonate monooxygenase SsuD/methylene tetrahydromethanopterin reductase-like flavin-dependent oxidoreductase (luciferase family)
MKFGIFYEHQLPKPWNEGDEARLFHEALEQVVLADRLGYDYAWEVEHHFLEEYSHSSAPEVFLAACAALTKNIRVGHGIRQVIANYNHPARTAEGLATLDIISKGRLDFGIGEGATRLELGGFGIPAKEKRAMALESAEQIANMLVMEPYPGFEGKSFSSRAATFCRSRCRSRIRRCGWPAPTATLSRSPHRKVSAPSPSPS